MKLEGRAYTPEEKRAIVERLLALWIEYPSLRLGQLIYIGTGGRDIFSVEDDAFIAEITEHIYLLTRRVTRLVE